MRKMLERWRGLLLQPCRVSVKRSLPRGELAHSRTVRLELTSGACYGDAPVGGIGGFAHGLDGYLPVPTHHRSLLSIPILEFLGAAFDALAFYPHLRGLLRTVEGVSGVLELDGVELNLRTDPLLPLLRSRESPCEPTYWWRPTRS